MERELSDDMKISVPTKLVKDPRPGQELLGQKFHGVRDTLAPARLLVLALPCGGCGEWLTGEVVCASLTVACAKNSHPHP